MIAANLFKKSSLLFHTLRYLRFEQIIGRVRYKSHKVEHDISPAPQLSQQTGVWVSVAHRSRKMLTAEQVKFLNVISEVKTSSDWNSSNQTKLWLYNLHYFDDLNSFDSKKRSDWHCLLIQRWIDENPIGFANGWEPYPSSLRIINWIKWALSGHKLDQKWKHSLAIQTRYLSQQLEVHLLGNHLFVNAKALVFAGLFFCNETGEADDWLETGLSILEREVPEQILEDGGQFELSPMYHALALEDMLDLCNICSAFPEEIPAKWNDLLLSFKRIPVSMLNWMQIMNHSDGGLSFFNDSAFDIAPSTNELVTYAERLGIHYSVVLDECVHLKDSGYIRVHKKNMLALLDVARVGPDYLPGHAHADTLSFELSLFGQRILVNSGTSCYGIDDERLRQRSTSAHNTVVINYENSSEVWGGFRVARRAKPFDLTIDDSLDGIKIGCSHDGYQRLKGKPIHYRQWFFNNEELLIKDTILGSYHNAEAQFHFHPDVRVESDDSYAQGIIHFNESKKVCWEVLSGEAELIASTYHPEFGLSLENQCLVVHFQSAIMTIRFFWLN